MRPKFGFGAVLVALLLAAVPYCGWCLYDRHLMVPYALQPIVWKTLDIGESTGVWTYDYERNDDWVTVSTRLVTLSMPGEEWVDLDRL